MKTWASPRVELVCAVRAGLGGQRVREAQHAFDPLLCQRVIAFVQLEAAVVTSVQVCRDQR